MFNCFLLRTDVKEIFMIHLKTIAPAETLDVQGRTCPYLIVLIKKEMVKLPVGSILSILCDSPVTAEDSIPRYCEKHGYQFESVKLEQKGCWEIYIQKV
jgi:tRNA 2-thiouridine synthesizing protein A